MRRAIGEVIAVFHAWEIILSAAAVVAGGYIAFVARAVWRVTQVGLEFQRQQLQTQRQQLLATLKNAQRLVVTVEFPDGRREELVERALPKSTVRQQEIKRALEELKTA